jgi:hypothetical protein
MFACREQAARLAQQAGQRVSAIKVKELKELKELQGKQAMKRLQLAAGKAEAEVVSKAVLVEEQPLLQAVKAADVT